ncbi:hypothetical protein K3495_g9162 [Podosphaera aphanis]|nr:hypothetical protein K3495_g9162 [Podosphaera aphanis]
MNTTAAYTPLECLLLFQSLVALGTEDEDFTHISELLKKTPLIRNSPSYDAQRLDADALRELYLNLLRDDSRLEEQDEFQENNHQTALTKQKISSPNLSSVYQNSQMYKHKLPLIADRLYAKYRDHMIRAIQEDEKKYATIQGQIEQIERGDWDERVLAGDEDADLETDLTHRPSDKNTGIRTEPPKTDSVLPGETKKLGYSATKSSTLKSSSLNQPRREELKMTPSKNGKKAQASNSPRNEDVRVDQHDLPLTKNGSGRPHKIPQLQTSPKPQSIQNCEPRFGPSSKPSQCRQSNQLLAQLLPKKHTASSPSSSPGSSSGSITNLSARSKSYVTTSSTPVHSPACGALLPLSTGTKTSGMPLDALVEAAGQQNHASSKLVSQPTSLQNPQGKFHSKKLAPNDSDQQNRKSTSAHKTERISNHPKKKHDPSSPLIQTKDKQYSSPYNKSHGLRYSILSHLLTPGPNIKSSKSCSSLLDTPSSNRLRKSITGSGTTWTPEPTGSTPRSLAPLASPQMEPLSPVENSARDRVHKQKNSASLDQNLEDDKSDCPIPATEGDSQVPEQALENQVDTHNVKQELATPQSLKDDVDANSKSQIISKQENFGPPPEAKPETLDRNESPSPSKILWTRAFPRISAQALQDISTDKNASMFANPIKDKDAPGYRSIILRPQDLKSIRSAIIAGHRAATAAAPEDLDPNETSAWLPISEDLIPPKGIVNYAQLEKELMRMFANAIMFNPDPKRGLGPAWQDAVQRSKEEALGYAFDEDSVVKGTKDMFAAVEKKVSDLRSVERRSKEAREAKSLKPQIENQQDDFEIPEEKHAGASGVVAKKRRKA